MNHLNEVRLRYGDTTFAVYEALRASREPLSRLQLAQRTGLPAKAIDNALTPLQARQYVVKVSRGLYTITEAVR